MKTNTLPGYNTAVEKLRTQLFETRSELLALATRPLEYLNEIRVSREHAVSYIETMLAQERALLRQLGGTGFERDVFVSEAEMSRALGFAARALRAVACQPSDTLGADVRLNCTIWAKAAEIALR
jgi:hypothetical protein